MESFGSFLASESEWGRIKETGRDKEEGSGKLAGTAEEGVWNL